jgi:hypothetical protein
MNTKSNPVSAAREMLRRDIPENYRSFEDATESIVTEIESRMEVSAQDASTIGDICEEWFSHESGGTL